MLKIVAVTLGLLILLLTGCSFAPKYHTPPMPIPAHFKETGPWIKTISPVHLKRTAWWELFHDQTLNELEQKVTCGNENIKIAFGRYMEARAIAQVARSAYYPTINGVANPVRLKNSTTTANSAAAPVTVYNTFLLAGVLTYEIDVWGRVRNTVTASESLARASAADLDAINLSMHAELANDYFALRGDEAAQRVLDETVIAYEKALFITRKRFEGGATSEVDFDQAKTQLETAKTLATDMRLKRAELEHAIAVLTGEIPANFKLPAGRPSIKLVTLSPDIPSTLLLRRPDVAAAAQRVRSANATIGVARAAFFPDFNLTTLIGVQSAQLSNLFSASSLFWSLGSSMALATIVQPGITQVLFDGYKLQGLLKYAKASYYEAVSAYRQTALTAFQEVEDSLVAIRRLDEEIKTQTASSTAAYRALYQANRRYVGGIATFLDVIITENEALQSKLALIILKTRRQTASIQLIKALGGGWCDPSKRPAVAFGSGSSGTKPRRVDKGA